MSDKNDEINKKKNNDDKGKKIEAEHYQLNEKVNKDDKGKRKMDDLQNRVKKLEVEIKGKQAKFDKGKGKHPDLDDVDLDLENEIKKLEMDFGRMLKAKKTKEAKHDQAKVNKEVVQVSSNKDVSSDLGVFGDEDLVLFNDVNYRLTDTEIRMFKERPTISRAPTRQVASTFTRSIAPSTRSRAPTASTSTRSRAPTASSYFYFQSIHKF
nr:hypothetical protein [Tanacetum cinerariifolium]